MDTTTGYFWDPNDTDNQVFGELTVSETGDQFDIKLFGMIRCVEEPMWRINYHPAIPVIQGYTSSKDCLSLFSLRVEHYENISHDTDPKSLNRKSTIIRLRCESYIVSDNYFFLGNEHFHVLI
ncbi:ApeA N-terminal domain 1-containing protein [Mucilaginibacter terrae]|uniref:ApeA N-terminal domain-containing protein n=1 Tax=Mucilaginibacter terrae TaxID=1955052 RepID=A0ABU3GQM0_9SPHI|nr:hypothetical protein [Mucilaginibacter terrae]MDT3401242.1 hypothetical protein [Mucilaginibacter terrae]